jgi:hypothetical protein
MVQQHLKDHTPNPTQMPLQEFFEKITAAAVAKLLDQVLVRVTQNCLATFERVWWRV